MESEQIKVTTYGMQPKLNLVEAYKEKHPVETWKFPQGVTYVEFLDEGAEKEIDYAREGEPSNKKARLCWSCNFFDADLKPIKEKFELAFPPSLYNAIGELWNWEARGVLAGKWLKVVREGSGKTDTKYLGFPQPAKPVVVNRGVN
jgi:hypothetical protein